MCSWSLVNSNADDRSKHTHMLKICRTIMRLCVNWALLHLFLALKFPHRSWAFKKSNLKSTALFIFQNLIPCIMRGETCSIQAVTFRVHDIPSRSLVSSCAPSIGCPLCSFSPCCRQSSWMLLPRIASLVCSECRSLLLTLRHSPVPGRPPGHCNRKSLHCQRCGGTHLPRLRWRQVPRCLGDPHLQEGSEGEGQVKL